MQTDLISRLEALTGPDNSLDVLVELALFKADDVWVRCRANTAGTKVVYTHRSGKKSVCWADDWTETPAKIRDTITALKAGASQ